MQVTLEGHPSIEYKITLTNDWLEQIENTNTSEAQI